MQGPEGRLREIPHYDARIVERLCVMGRTLLPIVIGLLLLFVAPIWPWSRGWTWAPAGMLAMGLATMLLFQYSVLPET